VCSGGGFVASFPFTKGKHYEMTLFYVHLLQRLGDRGGAVG
jgi:hypothetical protein